MTKPVRGAKTPSLFSSRVPEPLAARLRPRSLDEYIGQQHLLAPGMPLRLALSRGVVDSMILWGPPGVGKTTLARLFAQSADAAFVAFSAVSDGVARVREVVAEAEDRRDAGRGTILFVDEIHRFNRGQQDAFLPHVEAGTVILVGATTENPSFALTGALLSRTRVLVLEPISVGDLRSLVDRALADVERGLGARHITIADDARMLIAELADGDARRLLNSLEGASILVDDDGVIEGEQVQAAVQRRVPQYDKSGEEHYNLISAYHKAVRGSDPQGALYWLARMIEGGEDPRYLARRMVRMAAEDIGLADPQALVFTIAAAEMYERLGSPEGELALAEAAIYLATAPKSNKVYEAWGAALEAARNSPATKVPLHLRNAPTGLMKELGYGAGYQYAHSAPDAFIPQEYLPDSLQGAIFYEPGPFGFEKDIAKRLAWWANRREELMRPFNRLWRNCLMKNSVLTRISRRNLTRGAFALLVVVAAGCAALGRSTFAEPVVRLKDVAITGLGLQGGSVDVRLSIYNPNHFKLDALKMTYKVDIDSIPLGDGALDNRFTVNGGDSSEVRLPVKFTYSGLGAAGRSLMTSGSINYRVRGDFTVSTPLGNFTRPYDQKGRYNSVSGVGR